MRKPFERQLKFEGLEARRLLATDWTNAVNVLDVNVSGGVSALDALIVINDLNAVGARTLATNPPQVAGAKVDANSDGKVSAMDALWVINALNEFMAEPMSLDLTLEALPPQSNDTGSTESPVFSGTSLRRSQVRLEELSNGVATIKSRMTADAEGSFQFVLDLNSSTSLYRIVATDVLGRSKQVEFTFEPGQQLGSVSPSLTLYIPVGIGSIAPDFKLHNQDGDEVELAELLRTNPLVLYFYPRDNTPGCSAEAMDFSNRKQEIESLGAKVVGVSIDSVQSHREFADAYNINFDILSDFDRKVSASYGVLGERNGTPIAQRTTFIIGQDGIIKEVFSGVDVNIHGDQVITALQNGIAGRSQ